MMLCRLCGRCDVYSGCDVGDDVAMSVLNCDVFNDASMSVLNYDVYDKVAMSMVL